MQVGRNRTEDVPDLSALSFPQNEIMTAVEQAVLRNGGARVTASLAEQIAAKLAWLITMGRVGTGQRLVEQDVSATLGVSRAPVREALRILERDRLVEFRSRKGAMVNALSKRDLEDVFAVRRLLYGTFLREEMTTQWCDVKNVLDDHIPRILKDANDSVEQYVADTFLMNCALFEISQNRILAELLQSVSLQTMRYVRVGLASHPSEMPKYVESWTTLQAAVDAKDVDRAVEIAERRIDRIREAALDALDSGGGLEGGAEAG